MNVRADDVARAVLDQFAKLPSKRKPAVRDNGLHEWVPLSGVVAFRDGELFCVALATGMKCLPASKLPICNGVGIHDWHAEVLAIRAFNRFLLDECRSIQSAGGESPVVAPSNDVGGSSVTGRLPFKIRDDVKLYMYCSEAPCGDASMELTMAAQADDTPWEEVEAHQQSVLGHEALPGRAYFSQLGIVRRKPARGDAPPTMSKSCSDKIAAKQCLSLLSSVTSLFVHPGNAYIDTLVLPESRYSSVACARAFGEDGRMKAVKGVQWANGYKFQPFKVATTSLDFDYAKSSMEQRSSKISASNLAAAWSLSGIEETILGGVVQGRKAFDVKGASAMSGRAMWKAAIELNALCSAEEVDEHGLSEARMYKDVKGLASLEARHLVKSDLRSQALTGWIRNEGDVDFVLT